MIIPQMKLESFEVDIHYTIYNIYIFSIIAVYRFLTSNNNIIRTVNNIHLLSYSLQYNSNYDNIIRLK